VAALRDALLLHFRREEEALFPDLVDLMSEDAPEADIIAGFFRQESDDDVSAHTTLRLALHGIANLLEQMAVPNARPQHSVSALRDRFERARDLLSRHAEKEETVIFPMVERLLEEAQLRAIAARLATITSAT
jgi:hemerythrin-like domain-containing protein